MKVTVMSAENQLIARNVRRVRQERGVSLGELARRAGLAKQTLSTLEQGVGNPTIETLAAIGAALDVSLRRLLTEWGTPVVVQREADGVWTAEDGGGSRLLGQVYGSGHVRTSLHRLEGPGNSASARRRRHVEEISAHASGTLHHVYVITGRVHCGPSSEPVELAEGDFARYPADVPHRMEALTPRAVLHVVTTVPQPAQFGPADQPRT